MTSDKGENMKRFFMPLKKQDGFTLVELMVVVAIIGLLSAVAIPNFKKYQAKAKISEAKLQLSALYTAETAFFSDYNMYAKCLRYMGFDPAPEIGNRYYAIGFPTAGSLGDRVAGAHDAAVNSGMQAVDCPDDQLVTVDATNANVWYAAGKGVGGTILNAVADASTNTAGAATAAACTQAGIGTAAGTGSCLGTQADSANMVFQAAAVGYISGDFLTPATASGLNINHNKIIKSVVNGY